MLQVTVPLEDIMGGPRLSDIFDFCTTFTFIHYKFSPLIRLLYTKFGLLYTSDKQTL